MKTIKSFIEECSRQAMMMDEEEYKTLNKKLFDETKTLDILLDGEYLPQITQVSSLILQLIYSLEDEKERVVLMSYLISKLELKAIDALFTARIMEIEKEMEKEIEKEIEKEMEKEMEKELENALLRFNYDDESEG